VSTAQFIISIVITATLAVVANAIAVWAIISNRNENFKRAIDERFEIVVKESNNKFEKLQQSFNDMALQVNTILEGDVRELRVKFEKFEAGQDEWTKNLRERVHALATHTTRLEVDLVTLKGELALIKEQVRFIKEQSKQIKN